MRNQCIIKKYPKYLMIIGIALATQTPLIYHATANDGAELDPELEALLDLSGVQQRDSAESILNEMIKKTAPEQPPAVTIYPGKTDRIVDPYRVNAPNPLFLTSMPGKLWWDKQARARMPVLITEPVGLTRIRQPVGVIAEFPEGTAPESLRVVTPYGREIRSQVRVVDEANREFEVVFILDRLNAGEHLPLFVYYGDTRLDRPPLKADVSSPRIEKREKGIALLNNLVQVELSKTASRGENNRYPVWREIRRHGMEFNLISRFPSGAYHTSTHGVPEGTELRVLEDGPVRKTLGYGDWGEGYTVSLYADSPLIYINSVSGVQSYGFWLPGGDTLNDVLCYASEEGLKRMPISYTGGNVAPTRYNRLMEWFNEGWFALLDETREEGIGWFYDHESAARVSMQTLAYGYWINVWAPGQSAIYPANDAATQSVRRRYIAWKNPPAISIGNSQPYTKIEPETPMLGEDFIRMQILRQRVRPREDEHSAGKYLEEAQSFGANYIMFSSPWESGGFAYTRPSKGPDGEPGPAFFDELVRETRNRGMGMCHGLSIRLNPPVLRDLIARGANAVWLADEWGWRPGGYYPLNEEQRRLFIEGKWDWSHREFSEEERAAFKKRYGVAMPDAKVKVEEDAMKDLLQRLVDDRAGAEPQGVADAPEEEGKTPLAALEVTDLDDPSHRAMFRMMIDAHNKLMSDLANIARDENPDVFVSATTSPNNLSIGRGGAFHDLETHGDSLTSVVMDLYSNRTGWLNSMVKYSRGAQGNRRPLFIIGGYAGWDNAREVEKNLNFQVMFGANSLCYFIMERHNAPWAAMGSKRAFDMLDYTGFGDFAARAWPMEFAGVLRDRDAFFESFERYGAGGRSYERSIFQYIEALGFARPANVVSAKRLADEIKLPYKVMIVPENPWISAENVALLRRFVESGGQLIMESATVQNEEMAALAGVSPAGDSLSGTITVTGIKAPLEDWNVELMHSLRQRVTVTGADTEVLAVMEGDRPAITVASRGEGRVFYMAPRIGPLATHQSAGPMLRKLVEYAAGYIPVIILPEGSPAFSTVLTDGQRYAISVFNHADRQMRYTLAIEGFPEDLERLTSIRTGRSYPVDGNLVRDIMIGPQQTDYFVSGWPVVPATFAPSAQSVHGSLRPGMAFMNLPPLPQEKAD